MVRIPKAWKYLHPLPHHVYHHDYPIKQGIRYVLSTYKQYIVLY